MNTLFHFICCQPQGYSEKTIYFNIPQIVEFVVRDDTGAADVKLSNGSDYVLGKADADRLVHLLERLDAVEH